MYRIAVLGDRDSVLGFRALGLEVHAAETAREARETLKRLAGSGEVAVIYVTEEVAVRLAPEIDAYKDEIMPAILPIPGKSGSQGLGLARLKLSVERAVGADILNS